MALPSRHRLSGYRIIGRVYRDALKFHTSCLVLRVLNDNIKFDSNEFKCHPISMWRCGIVISSKVSKKAVMRNRLRRQLHSFLLANPPSTTTPVLLLISLKPNRKPIPPEQLVRECSNVLRKAGLSHGN